MSKDNISQEALKKAFAGISDEEVLKLLAKGKVAEYPPGSVLCQEDVVEDVFYILLEGEVKVSKKLDDEESRLLKHLNAGDFFGEMGIIHNAARAATVATTVGPCASSRRSSRRPAKTSPRSSTLPSTTEGSVAWGLRTDGVRELEHTQQRVRELRAGRACSLNLRIAGRGSAPPVCTKYNFFWLRTARCPCCSGQYGGT